MSIIHRFRTSITTNPSAGAIALDRRRSTLLFQLAAALCLIGTAPAALAQVDTADQCNVLDPEFHDALDLMIYQRIHITSESPATVTQEAKAERLNTSTGEPDENSAVVLASDLLPYNASQVGPKWAHGKRSGVPEDYVVSSRLLNGTDRVAGIRAYAPGGGCTPTQPLSNCFPDDINHVGTVPITIVNHDDQRKVVYTSEDETMDFMPAQMIYNFNNDPADLNELRWLAPFAVLAGNDFENKFSSPSVQFGRMQELKTGTNFTTRELWISTTYFFGNPAKAQVFLVKPTDTTTQIQVTTSTLNKFNPWLFFHPDPNGDGDTSDHTNMVVYKEHLGTQLTAPKSYITVSKQTATGWELFMKIDPADIETTDPDLKYLLSPETFTIGNNVYVIFSSSDDLDLSMAGKGHVWVVRLVSGRLSVPKEQIDIPAGGNDDRVRSEVEVYMSDNGPVFFYTLKIIANQEEGCTLFANPLANYSLHRVTGVPLPQ